MEIAFVQVDDGVRLQMNASEKKTSGICIDAVVAVMDIIWSFVSYLRRQFRVTKEAAMQYTNPIQFGSVTSFGCL